jgi:transcriptional regulator of met regulon
MTKNNNVKNISISIPEKWILKLKRKALKRIEKTHKHVTVSELVMEALEGQFGFKIEEE